MFKVYNTMSRRVEPFRPVRKKIVKIFTCGPSVYQRAHLGNFRTYLYEDVLIRYLEFKGYSVKRVMPFTDVEDKSIERARREKIPLERLTERYSRIFLKDADFLGLKPPTKIPRSSMSVGQAAKLVQALLKSGHAYWHGGSVYFDPLKFKGFGKLSRLDMSKWPKRKRRFHRDNYPGSPWNRGDFILWHGCGEGDEVCWETPLGRGRPAWNVQDPAMAAEHLGLELDFFCGGMDNLVRHHDYNIAVAESVSGRPLARYWMHGAHLLANGRKMSKSLGNIVYVEGLEKRGHDGRQIRFYLVYGHYRKRMNFSHGSFRKAAKKLEDFEEMVEQISRKKNLAKKRSPASESLLEKLGRDFEASMDEDLDVRRAFDGLSRGVSKLARLKKRGKVAPADVRELNETLRRVDGVLKIFKR